MPIGMLLASIGNQEPRSYAPLDTPHIFLENGTQTVKMQFDTFPVLRKYKTAVISILARIKITAVYYVTLKSVLYIPWLFSDRNIQITNFYIEVIQIM